MVEIRLFCVIVAVAGWSPTLAEGEATAQASSDLVRQPRSLIKKKLCLKLGICDGFGGNGGYQGGYGGYQGGYGGYQGGHGGYPPVNIAISQSQSSSNEGGGGYGSGYHPNNYQYNGGYPNQGYNRYPHNGYGGYRPGYDNRPYAHNNQFNGNFYSGNPYDRYGHPDGYDYQDGYQGSYYGGNGYGGDYYGGNGYEGGYGYQDGEDGYNDDEAERSADDGASARSIATSTASTKS